MDSKDKVAVLGLGLLALAIVLVVGVTHWYAYQERAMAMEHGYEQIMIPDTNLLIWRKSDPSHK